MAFLAAIFEFQIRAVHLKSECNRIADALSRFDMGQHVQYRELFSDLTKGFVLQECVVSPNMFHFQNSW